MAPPSSEAEARAFLDHAVELAQAGDFAGLCAIGGGNCGTFLDEVGRDVPEEHPWIVGTRIQAPTTTTHGGVVLEMCGHDSTGQLYYSEMVVSYAQDDHLIAIEPVYWAGILIADGPDVGSHIGQEMTSRCM